MFSTIQVGAKNSKDYKLYLTKNNKIISPWHDIDPLHDGYITCVNEIPRYTNAKLEINKLVPSNPIIQDIKKDKLRYITNIFPMKGYIWNYGAIPRTWENPHIPDPFCNINGDNDPLDVIEIGEVKKKRGEVYNAKVLGCLVLIDEGECDYKIVVVDIKSEFANEMEDIGDVEKMCPGLLKRTKKWFTMYKIPDGKKENQFAFNGEFMDKEFTMKVIRHSIGQYNEMIKGNEYKRVSVDQNGIEPYNGKSAKEPVDVKKFYFIKK